MDRDPGGPKTSGSGSGSVRIRTPTLLLTLSDPVCGAGQDDLLWCASCGEGYNQEVLAAKDSPSTPPACSKCGGDLEHSKVPYSYRTFGPYFNVFTIAKIKLEPKYLL